MQITLKYYVIELSKYLIAFTMLLYTGLALVCNFSKNKKAVSICCSLQSGVLLVLMFLCFLDMTFVSGKEEYLYLFAFITLFLFFMITIVTIIYDKADRVLLNNMCLLSGLGLCIVSRLSFTRAFRQYIITLVSFAICLAIPFVIERFRFFRKLLWVYAGVGIVALLIVLTGTKVNGAHITYTIKGFTFQPSEIVKILFLFFIAALLYKYNDLKWIFISAVISGCFVIILVLSKDLGSALIFFVAYFMILIMSTHNYWYLLTGLAGGAIACVAAYNIFDHVKVRVVAFLDPWTYIDDQAYQITQSLFAISSGGWFGAGLMQGRPWDIPYVDQDLIFSAMCEEFGLLFALCVLTICLCCFYRMMFMSRIIGDKFYQIVVYGIGVMYIFQVFLTVGGGIKFIPLTGVTLPFISYGGSSVLSTFIMFFIVQGIYIKSLKYEKSLDEKNTKPDTKVH
ncbi:MAG: FtsW/RodA/SpoVE family cell cycle protein [Lachnospiraceae bacterium]|nr:FtsW/RodA/SpoVE family cell cycle protein [Lachnospiraceae bacterium]